MISVSLAALLVGVSANAVMNGERIPESLYPAVKRVVVGGNGTCTGTFISPFLMLTAAHCADAHIDSVDGFVPERVLLHDKWKSNAKDKLAYDVALVKFGWNAAFPKNALAAAEAREGDPVVLVGYGIADGAVGLKRMGRNTIHESIWGQYLLTGSPYDATRATGTGGDSGGALLNERGELIGVTSRESVPGMTMGGRPEHMSSYIAVDAPEIRAFIRDASVELMKPARRGD